ncbi:MAG: hypothetical protein K0T01_1935 [Acidimicrobiia bacterium]|jgi:hypothetical protein|nr:hypothetical protein [Acidimicrobiia bacterium]
MARTFADRLLGVWRVPAGSAVVLPVTSVHSFGRRRPLDLVGVDAGMRVVATKTLPPNRVTVLRSACMIVELPAGSPLPELGDEIQITDE